MKASLASAFASLPLLAVVSAFEIPPWEKFSIGDAACKNLKITNGNVFEATCENPDSDPKNRKPIDMSLDLDGCFANYKGTLNYVSNGGFSASCKNTHLNGTILVSDCSKGKGLGTQNTQYELNDWRTIRLALSDFNLRCGSEEGIEKRADDKQARSFIA